MVDTEYLTEEKNSNYPMEHRKNEKGGHYYNNVANFNKVICGNMLLQSTGLLVTSVTLLILDFFTTSHIYVWAIIESDK